MAHVLVDEQELQALQQRAEAMAHGDFSLSGGAASSVAALEDLRRAIDVLGAHTEQGLSRQHAYVAALSTAQEAERGRLARELHDEVVQALIALGHQLDRAQRILNNEPAQAAERLRETRAGLTELVNELRLIIGALRPPALEELGLVPALEVLLQRDKLADAPIELHVEGRPRRLAPQSELAVFRIVQEACNNIRRHAAARHAGVLLSFLHDRLQVTVQDDGVGFALPDGQHAPDGHWGVRGMRERSELIGGHLRITSTGGQGTRIDLHVPYPGVDGRDLVCGMAVGPEALGVEHAGQLYRFCSPACRDLFLAHPKQYVTPE